MSIPPHVREFAEVLRDMENGDVNEDLTEQLQQLIGAVQDVRKGGTLTLTMTVTPTSRATVAMATAIKCKIPEHDRASTTFFVDDRQQLHREDPKQVKMDLRDPNAQADLPEALRDATPIDPPKGLRVVGDQPTEE